ncbi:hypothetical protein BC833DRAFT_610518 [Globomyces pollinis-pini]|nr:hypothetical protein BC833DRAFT_610518 [Globomyces pollinis-pini]
MINHHQNTNNQMQNNQSNQQQQQNWNLNHSPISSNHQQQFQLQQQYNMQIRNEILSPFLQNTPYSQNDNYQFNDDQTFSPLVSPAITPDVNFNQLSLQAQVNFSNLSSPALHPHPQRGLSTDSNLDLQNNNMNSSPFMNHFIAPQKRNSAQNFVSSPLALSTSKSFQLNPNDNQFSLGTSAISQQSNQSGLMSPPNSFQMYPTQSDQQPLTPLALAPITPSQLMQINTNPKSYDMNKQEMYKQFQNSNQSDFNSNGSTLQTDNYNNGKEKRGRSTKRKSLTNMKPILPDVSSSRTDAVDVLSQRSNYQNLIDGHSEQLGLKHDSTYTNGVQYKRTTHKEAEQRRRDNLKHSFKLMREVLPPMKEKAPSKVFVLKRAREYVLELKHETNEKSKEVDYLRSHIANLSKLLSESGQHVPELPQFTKEEYVEEFNSDLDHSDGDL